MRPLRLLNSLRICVLVSMGWLFSIFLQFLFMGWLWWPPYLTQSNVFTILKKKAEELLWIMPMLPWKFWWQIWVQRTEVKVRQDGNLYEKSGNKYYKGQRLYTFTWLQTIQMPPIKVAPEMQPSQIYINCTTSLQVTNIPQWNLLFSCIWGLLLFIKHILVVGLHAYNQLTVEAWG